MAMSVGHVTILPGVTTSFALVPDLASEQPYQLLQGKAGQGQGSSYSDYHIQQKVLVGGHLVHGGAQMAGTVVTEDVADPVGGSGRRVAWLVFVNLGEKTRLLAVPT